MRPQHPPASAAEAPACKCCGMTYDAGAVTPIGILEGPAGDPPLILYQCRCGTTRAVSWVQATDRLRLEAREEERRRADQPKTNRR